ncbi:MAG TPA: neprosin family prolyl endopeptidase [Geminicoccaceae bacterium]|nr:neprosin family prolyl endopeptidase [Geminicoccaceae bacterium]
MTLLDGYGSAARASSSDIIALANANVKGRWTGTATQPGGPTVPVFETRINIHQNSDGTISGERFIYVPSNPAYYGRFSFTGTVRGNTISFRENSIVSQNPAPRTRWCLFSVKLTYYSARNTMTGPWSSPGCAPGIVTVAKAPTHYFYAGARQALNQSIGIQGDFSTARPSLVVRDHHTLAELAAQSADGKQIIEVGWTVDRQLNNDSEPHLFVFYWVDGKAAPFSSGQYNSGFEHYTTRPDRLPGAKVVVSNTPVRLAIRHHNSEWWIFYKDQWIGYFPDSLWTNRFKNLGLGQWFGEVAASTRQPTTWMGNGLHGNYALSSFMRNMGFTTPNGRGYRAYTEKYESVHSFYSIGLPTVNSIHYGGKGK